ncbi:zinc finger BED domain-containing protein RICESLEEPER 2-like isoform X2 [Oryza sativa Japonica Group]|uniref:zinc finger BED domain-containing protein RICESLEEPER 2-like isoform X2 n=1 Tax=Oryza sativa subsp. japonica TaxID=39947 RepID=UPI0007755016|nr:zinc finger BED domain-containing protein RICESLEEPER 2-like isoform X2 [Oryza sativa Japonica Group]
MENQSGQPQYAMADQGFHPFSPFMLAPSTTMQQHVGSSSSTPVIQVAALPSHAYYGNIDVADDGFHWRMCGQSTIQGGLCPTVFSYQCALPNCGVRKSITRSADGQTIETVCKGCHNHPRQSLRWLGDGSERLEPISQEIVLLEASDASGAAGGPSVPGTGNGHGQSSGSSDSCRDDDGDLGIDGNASVGDANAVKSGQVPAPAKEITVHSACEVDILNNSVRHENPQPRKKVRSKSTVWEEFEVVLIDGKVQTAECKHCKKGLSAKTSGGTSHLIRHLKICPAQHGTSRVQKKCSSLADLPIVKSWKDDQESSLDEIIRSIVSNLCPFSAMYSASFAQFLAGRNPVLNMVQQATVEEKFLSVFHNEKMKLKEKITATPGGVFLSLGEWQRLFYIQVRVACLTVHFIDEDWKINRKTIRCSLSVFGKSDILSLYPHWQSDIVLAEKVLKEVVQDWGLLDKLLGVTLQRSVDKKAPLHLEDDITGRNYLLSKCRLLSIPCMVDALHELMDSTVLDMESTWSHYMTSSPERKQKYQEILSQLHLDRPSLGSKGWYFTFYFSEAALQFIKSFPLPDAKPNCQSGPWEPSFDDLEATENYCKIARSAYRVIKVVSGPHNMTFNSYFHVIWSLRAAIQELPSIKNIGRVFDVAYMQKKFDRNWKKWYLWLSIAVVLDPRYKLGFIELCFRQAFSHVAGMYFSEVRAKLHELYIQYSYVNEQSKEILDHKNNCSDIQISAPLHNKGQNSTTAQAAVEEFKELYEYLGGGLCTQDDSFDILKWWRGNSSAYPTLAMMARDILAIPGCAVSTESAFDQCDQRAELFDGKLRPETTEALICAQSWIKSSADADDGNKNTSF